MKKLIVILFVLFISGGSAFAAASVLQNNPDSVNETTQPTNEPSDKIVDKPSEPTSTKVHNKKTAGNTLSNVPSTSNSNKASNNIIANTPVNVGAPVPAQTLTTTPEPTSVPTTHPSPTTVPTIEPTVIPTAEPTQSLSPTPTVTVAPTATPVPTITPTPKVQQFALNVSTFEIPSGGQGLNLVEHNGRLWFAVDRTGPNWYKYPENVVLAKDVVGSIGNVTITGEVTEYFLPTGSNKPINLDVGEFQFRITEGSDGNIWFTQPNANIVGKLTDDGMLTEYQYTKDVEAHAITAGPDGTMYVMDFHGGLTGMDIEGNIYGNIPSVYGVSMVSGTDGSLWVGSHDVYKFASDGSMSTYPLEGRAVKIINGANNDVWLSQNGGHLTNVSSTGIVTTYETPGFQAWNLTMDANNNIWYKDSIANKIYSLNPTTGNISSYLLSESESYFSTRDIIAGPDGNLWFTQDGKVGKIDISNLGSVIATTPYKPGEAYNPWVDNVRVLPCTSSSCGDLLTIVVDGWYFANDAQIILKGRELDASGSKINVYSTTTNGQIVNRVNDRKILADFQNVACDVYDVFIYSESTNKLGTFNNLNLKPYTCN